MACVKSLHSKYLILLCIASLVIAAQGQLTQKCADDSTCARGNECIDGVCTSKDDDFCIDHSDCNDYRACIKSKCVNPCNTTTCQWYEICYPRDHTSNCATLKQYIYQYIREFFNEKCDKDCLWNKKT